MSATHYTLEVQPSLPPRLARLDELANDLHYGWNRHIRGLYYRLDPQLWEACGHNPRVFLRRVAQEKLDTASADRAFMEEYNRVLSAYDTYNQEKVSQALKLCFNADTDLVAYFCAEFGFHESLPLYSGGLGILAGDHCKAASDLGLPFIAIGLLYRQGYFVQTINAHGQQEAHNIPNRFQDLPMTPALDATGKRVVVHVELPGRKVALRVWRIKAGHITLYLLDSDLDENSPADRVITYQLYGGDVQTRIHQEIVLGIGGVRALRALGIQPSVWHINEGHAAFMLLERMREAVRDGLDADSALELVAGNTVFTTHTPVPAGHDIFPHEMMQSYFGECARDLKLDMPAFLALGASPGHVNGFNQTALALRGSRFRNGVSRIHGEVAARMEGYIWPEIEATENPIGHVTNGVHVPTFLAREWGNLFDMRLGGGWRNELLNPGFWNVVDEIPGHSFWSVRQSLKSELLEDARRRVMRQMRRHGSSEALARRVTRHLDPDNGDMLILGFARRFATYKRATLLLSDPTRLARLLNQPGRPVMLMFAGKAHPQDKPGQEFIRQIHEMSRRPEFEGKIVLLEGYDQALARKLVTGVDVWVNTPVFPMEASGTSGMKAGINGVLNLSVLDGWWGEGYDGENGWAITAHGPEFDAQYRDHEESRELMDLIEEEIIPLFFDRNSHGYPEHWVQRSKASMRTVLPLFNSSRMVMDYVRGSYAPACRQQKVLSANGCARAKEIAEWRKRVTRAWPNVKLNRLDSPPSQLRSGETLELRLGVHLNGLMVEDVLIECLVGVEDGNGQFTTRACHMFKSAGPHENGETLFRLLLTPHLSGLQSHRIRIYPFHPSLAHRYEVGLMKWL